VKIRNSRDEWHVIGEPDRSKLELAFWCEQEENQTIKSIMNEIVNSFKSAGMTMGLRDDLVSVSDNVDIADLGKLMIEYFNR